MKIKRKGAAYAYGPDLGWHQNHSAQIIAIAAEAALVHNKDIAQTVYERPDIMDFMKRTKVPRSSKLMWGDEQVQNITRYLVTTEGASLTKVMPPTAAQLRKNPEAPDRRIGVDVGRLVTPCNDLSTPPSRDIIDYEYYIKEVEKIVNPLIQGTPT